MLNLLNNSQIENINKYFEKTKIKEFISCTGRSNSKDGPSAGTAITIAIYSLLTVKKLIIISQ